MSDYMDALRAAEDLLREQLYDRALDATTGLHTRELLVTAVFDVIAEQCDKMKKPDARRDEDDGWNHALEELANMLRSDMLRTRPPAWCLAGNSIHRWPNSTNEGDGRMKSEALRFHRGSMASGSASFHFRLAMLAYLQSRGVTPEDAARITDRFYEQFGRPTGSDDEDELWAWLESEASAHGMLGALPDNLT